MYFSKKPINQCIKNAFLFLTASAALLSSSHADSTLVYCPEANPEGFAPMLYSTGTTSPPNEADILHDYRTHGVQGQS